MSRAAAASTRAIADEPDRLEGFSAPREVGDLIGHAAALSEFEAALQDGRMHHAWLIVGPEGVGKATLAYRMARAVLADGERGGEQAEALFRKVAGLAHPNLLLIRRSYNDKTKRYSQWIGVDEVRRLRNFLGHSAGIAGWRAVIVDRADELNQNAANALLKALEEPPPRTLFLLVAAAEGRIPVTIRSRTRTLRVAALSESDLRKAVEAALARDGHEVELATLVTALALSQGSVRRALELATGEGIALYGDLIEHFRRLPEIDGQALHRLAERVGAHAENERFELFFSLLLALIERLIRNAATGAGAAGDEHALGAKLVDRANLAQWAEAWEEIGRAKADVTALNLDRANFVLDTFRQLQSMTRRRAA
jgi:DNA polymerase-3 subunit delta'